MSNHYQIQLTRVQNAILKLETKAVTEISILGRVVKYVDIQSLYDREFWLMNQIGKESRNGKIKVTSLST